MWVIQVIQPVTGNLVYKLKHVSPLTLRVGPKRPGMCGFGVSQKAPLELDFRRMGSPTLTPTAPLIPSP